MFAFGRLVTNEEEGKIKHLQAGYFFPKLGLLVVRTLNGIFLRQTATFAAQIQKLMCADKVEIICTRWFLMFVALLSGCCIRGCFHDMKYHCQIDNIFPIFLLSDLHIGMPVAVWRL